LARYSSHYPLSGLLQRCDIEGSGSTSPDAGEENADAGEKNAESEEGAMKRPAAKKGKDSRKKKKDDDHEVTRVGEEKGNDDDDEDADDVGSQDEPKKRPSKRKESGKHKDKKDSKKHKKEKKTKSSRGKKHAGAGDSSGSDSDKESKAPKVSQEDLLQSFERARQAEELALQKLSKDCKTLQQHTNNINSIILSKTSVHICQYVRHHYHTNLLSFLPCFVVSLITAWQETQPDALADDCCSDTTLDCGRGGVGHLSMH
jgi:hypothetical protein